MSAAGSHYTVLARRFRPQAFDDVVGQDHVARALRNAIRAGRVAHAYMFTGARGVGKTSTARILAKALNCPNVVDGVPCNQCEICNGISAGNDVDVLEIDGASNRGIDDIRSLRANVGVRSMRTQFKVYIIDEVHMLTREAFNALLKTLEEPPPNVKFVFCTTEPNKVPDTILSRCQRFDFSSINETSIADRLREIAKAEGFEVAEDALELVSRRARGSMRDSQSLFDQLLAFSDGTVTADDVHRMLGTAGDERLVEIFTAIVEHRPGEVLSLLDMCFVAGVQPGELMDQCIGYVRDLMVTLSGSAGLALCSVATRHRDTLRAHGQRLGMHSIMAAFQILADGKSQMFRSTFARTVLEMAMVQLSLLENLTALSDLLSGRLPELPAGAVGTGAAPAAVAGATTAAAAVSGTTTAEKKNSDGLTESLPGGVDSQAAAVSVVTVSAVNSKPGSAAETTKTVAGGAAGVGGKSVVAGDGREPAGASKVVASEGSVAPILELTEANCGQLLKELIRTAGLAAAAGLKNARGMTLATPSRLEILLDQDADFAKKALDAPDNRTKMESEILRLTGKVVAVGLRLMPVDRKTDSGSRSEESAAVGEPRSPDGKAGRDAAARTPPAKQGKETRREAPEVPQSNMIGEVDASKDPFVRRVVEAFGATVVKVTKAPVVRVEDSEA
ncbi:MAG: DNA polymerase III subunit gamma/tau [Planctomycetia bacterium]